MAAPLTLTHLNRMTPGLTSDTHASQRMAPGSTSDTPTLTRVGHRVACEYSCLFRDRSFLCARCGRVVDHVVSED